MGFEQETLIYLLREYYIKPKRELRSCHPRDLLRVLIGFARYHNTPPQFTPDMIDKACAVYFAVF